MCCVLLRVVGFDPKCLCDYDVLIKYDNKLHLNIIIVIIFSRLKLTLISKFNTWHFWPQK